MSYEPYHTDSTTKITSTYILSILNANFLKNMDKLHFSKCQIIYHQVLHIIKGIELKLYLNKNLR